MHIHTRHAPRQRKSFSRGGGFLAAQAGLAALFMLPFVVLGQEGAAAYGVDVRFRYTAAGQEYRGQRASLHIGNGNASLYYQQLGERLEAAQRTGTPVPVWVNPAQPTESMADRSLRLDLLALELVVALGFTGCGLGVWWVLLRIWRSQRRGSLPRSAS